MSRIRRPLAYLAITGVVAASAAGCGGQPVSYAPAAYGQVIGGVGHCYWINSPAEATSLLVRHLCPVGWVATQAPPAWEVRYYRYYTSPTYITTYVPVSARGAYIAADGRFGRQHPAAIRAASTSSTTLYRGSNGKLVPASKIGAAKFSSGNAPSVGVGAGSARGGSSTTRTGTRTVTRSGSGTAPRPAAVPRGGGFNSGRGRR